MFASKARFEKMGREFTIHVNYTHMNWFMFDINLAKHLSGYKNGMIDSSFENVNFG